MRNYQLQKREVAVQGSIGDIAHRRGESLEVVIAEADVIVLYDCSSSMNERLSSGQTRHQVAKEQLEILQRDHQGRVVLFCFNDKTWWSQTGIPGEPEGGTRLLPALEKVKPFDGGEMKFVIISDGEPFDGPQSIALADTFTDPISTVYIGRDDGPGKILMDRLARNGGQALGRIEPKMLGSGIAGLIGEGGSRA